MSYLDPGSTVGLRWTSVAVSAHGHLRDGVDTALRLREIRNGRLSTPTISGPIIYLAIGHQIAQYVGQTYRTMQERLTEHLSEERKARQWAYLACIRLRADTPASEVDRLEALAHTRMRPAMGKAKPRTRRIA